MWNSYKKYVRGIIMPDNDDALKDISYWRNELFCNIIIYIIPISFIALVPGVFMSVLNGIPFLAIFDLVVFTILVVIAVNRKLLLRVRKIIFISCLYCLSTVLLYYLSELGPGMLYLLALTVTTTVVFSLEAAYYSVLANLIICVIFGLLIHFGFNSTFFNNYTVGSWIAVSANLVTLSLICAVCLNTLIIGLEKTIAERKRAEEELLLGMSSLNNAQHIARIGSWEGNIETGKIIWSAEMYRIYNCDPETFTPCTDTLFGLIHPEDRDAMSKWIAASSTGTNPGSLDYRINAADGSVKYLHSQGEITFNKAGKPLKVTGTVQDISERKKNEKELLISEAKLKQAQAIAHVGSWNLDFATNKVMWSDEACRIHGILPQELQGSFEFWLSFIHPEDLDYVKKEIEKSQASFSDSSLYFRIVRRDGAVRYIYSVTKFEYNLERKPIGLYGIAQDITEKKEEEEKLEKSIKQIVDYKYALDASSIVSITNNKGEITYVNDNFCRISKYPREELIGQHHRINNSGYHSKEFFKDLWTTLLKGEIWRGEIKNKAKDGTGYWVNTTIVPFLDEEKNPFQFLVIRSEITKRKEVEEILRESEANLTAILENNDAHVYSIDRDFRYVKFNTRLKNSMKLAYGIDIKQGDNTFNFLESIDPSEATRWLEVYTKALSGEPVYLIKDYSANNIPFFMSFSIIPIFEDKKIIGLSCFSRDITNETLAKELQIKSEKQSRDFARHITQVLEDERSRIAREIHDEFGQQFAGIKMGLSLFKKIGTADKTMEEKVNSMTKDVDSVIQALKKIATELRPGILTTLGLIPSIEWLAHEFEEKRTIKCKLNLNVQKQKFDEKISICFFRICQEALTNVSKHAKASEVIISMSHDKDTLILQIADNGKGYSTENPAKLFSMGLIGMRERANIIGADLQIISKKDVGTTIQLKAQLN